MCILVSTIRTATSFGQNHPTVSIFGKLIDKENQQPIPFASVAVYALPDTVLITGVTTNSGGDFRIEKVRLGQYVLKMSFIGYKTAFKTVTIKDKPIQLSEPIQMTSSAFSIGEVVVTGAQKEKHASIGKTKINIRQNIASVSGNITGTETETGQPNLPFSRMNDIVFSRRMFEATFSYKNAFVKHKNELALDVSFSKNRGRRPVAYYIEDVLSQKGTGGGAPTNATVQIDYLASV